MGNRIATSLNALGFSIVLTLSASTCLAIGSDTHLKFPQKVSYKGIALSAYWHDALDNDYLEVQLDYYRQLGFNAVELTPTWYQRNYDGNTVFCDPQRTVKTDDLIALIKLAKKSPRNLAINLKPHIEPFPSELGTERQICSKGRNIGRAIEESLLSECLVPVESPSGDLLPGCQFVKPPKRSHKELKHCKEVFSAHPSPEYWRAYIYPADKERWFASYEKFLLYYLRIAVELKVELFTVGTELVSVTEPSDENIRYWSALIHGLKSKAAVWAEETGGAVPKFLYAAHEHEIFGKPDPMEGNDSCIPITVADTPENNWKVKRYWIEDKSSLVARRHNKNLREFWGLFDAISMTLYFELGEKRTRDVGQEFIPNDAAGDPKTMRCRAKQRVDRLERWIRALGYPEKPVIIGEMGYRSVDFGHYKPYETHGPVFENLSDDHYNEGSQRHAFEAMLNTLGKREWLDGIFIWQEEIREPPAFFRRDNTSYSLIGKPASELFEKKLTGEANPPKRQLSRVSQRLDRLERYDLMTGGGLDRGETKSDEWFYWLKARARPWKIGLPLKNPSFVEIGLWYSYALGGGDLPTFNSSYEWDRHLAGPTAKLYGNGWSMDLDLGLGTIGDKSWNWTNSYRSQQDDDLFYLFTHVDMNYRRSKNCRWFPHTALDLEFTHPFNTTQSRSFAGIPLPEDPFERRRLELTLTQGVADFPLDPLGEIRFTPNILFKYLEESGTVDSTAIGIGFAIGRKLTNESGDIVTFSLFREQGGAEEATKAFLFVDLLKLVGNYK